MGDRLTEIKERVEIGLTPDLTTASWLIGEIEGLRAISQADQAVILELRQERLAAINEADAYRRERDDLRAKLARTKQLAVSLTERPTR